ncbi:unnamed protein product [Lathyrus oleraceus]
MLETLVTTAPEHSAMVIKTLNQGHANISTQNLYLFTLEKQILYNLLYFSRLRPTREDGGCRPIAATPPSSLANQPPKFKTNNANPPSFWPTNPNPNSLFAQTLSNTQIGLR